MKTYAIKTNGKLDKGVSPNPFQATYAQAVARFGIMISIQAGATELVEIVNGKEKICYSLGQFTYV